VSRIVSARLPAGPSRDELSQACRPCEARPLRTAHVQLGRWAAFPALMLCPVELEQVVGQSDHCPLAADLRQSTQQKAARAAQNSGTAPAGCIPLGRASTGSAVEQGVAALNALPLDGLMLKVKPFLIFVQVGIAGCTHVGERTGVRQPQPAPVQTCFRPGAGEFVSPLPLGMSHEEALAKGIIGSLDKEGIRQVIRRNIAEVRACYERPLTRQPDLTGRVTIQFVIAGNGTVSDSRLVSSTLSAEATEVCIAERACGWRFAPTNGGGPVIVTYPFNLKTGMEPES
jgi:hypothetical protein